MKHHTVRKTEKQLKDQYKNRDLETELKWMAVHTQSGYFRVEEAEFIRWLCYAALDSIKEKK